MVKSEKRIARMRNNPQGDWRIEDLKTIAVQKGLDWRQPGTSHVTFSVPGGPLLTVPAHKPIKAVYIRRFLALIDLTGESDD